MSFKLTVGRVSVPTVPVYTNEAIAAFYTRDGVDPVFLSYALPQAAIGGPSDHAVKGLTLNTAKLRKLPLLLPPLPEQRKIAEVLSSVDDAIEKTEAVIEQVRRAKRALAQELLTRGLPGRHSRFKHTEVGEIPEDWEVVRLADIADVERGKFAHRPRTDPRFYGGPYPFIQTGDVIESGGRIRTYSQTLNEAGLAISRLFPAGTIVLTIAANIGETAITEFDVAFPDSLVGITPRRVNRRFLEYLLRTRRNYLAYVATESAQKNINLQTLRPLLLPLPPPAEQRLLADTMEAMDRRETGEGAYLAELRQSKTTLMQVLLTGQARVRVEQEARLGDMA